MNEYHGIDREVYMKGKFEMNTYNLHEGYRNVEVRCKLRVPNDPNICHQERAQVALI